MNQHPADSWILLGLALIVAVYAVVSGDYGWLIAAGLSGCAAALRLSGRDRWPRRRHG